MTLGLIVPMRVDALLIGLIDANEDTYFLPSYADFRPLPYRGGPTVPYLSSVVLNRPFQGSAALPQGIHLHWQLPRALRRGAYNELEQLELPAVPDRWLITRVLSDLTASAPSITLRSWVVESNYLASDAAFSATTIPYVTTSATEKPYRYMGRVYDYATWIEGGERGTYFEPLNAMGYGIPDFATYYPNCRNVFGFHDATLNDVTFSAGQFAIAYIVTGWYSNQNNNPFPIPEEWIYPHEAGTPEYSLCSGAVYALDWPKAAYFRDFRTSLTPDIAIGNTPAEAFSTLAAYKVRDSGLPDVEMLLNALQLGVLPYLGQQDGMARLEEALFNASFAATGDGVLWQVGPENTDEPAEKLFAAAADSLAEDLARLNELQRSFEREDARATSLRSQIFSDWTRYMVIKYSNEPERYPDVNAVRDFITKEVAELSGITTTMQSLAVEIETLRAHLAAGLPFGLSLLALAAPRYYQPADPVVLLSGDGVPPPPPDDAPAIRCVLTSERVSALQLPANVVPGSAAITLDANALPTLPDASRLPYDAIAQLVQSTMLVDPQLAPALASAMAAQGGANNPAVMDFGATAEAIATAPTFVGSFAEPAIAMRAWTSPWNPVALSWRFRMRAPLGTERGYDPQFVLDNFLFDDTALDFEPKERTFATEIQEYTGTILLSPDASINLQRQIRQYLEYETSPELQEILELLGRYPLLAQSLGGFNADALMLLLTMQMPVDDPIAATRASRDFSAVTVHDAVAAQNRMTPMPSATYNPIRAGRMMLAEIILISEFGQYRSVDLSRLIVSDTIETEGSALLPPLRISQPAQVEARWLAAADGRREASTLPTSGPICGWVVPNHLDDSLMFYDGTGAAIGMLAAGSAGTVWLNAPGVSVPVGTMEDAFAGRNPVLAAFAASVRANGSDYLSAMIRTIDRTRVFIAPQNSEQSQVTAALVGAPLALVQARLGIELYGFPSPNQSYEALRRDIESGSVRHRSTAGFPEVRFPLILGSTSQFDDGLIGYFLEGFERFYANAADGANAHIVKPETSTLTVAPADEARVATMLVDPRAGVHVFSGIAPVKIITLPADTYALAVRAMAFTFLTAPVLALPSGVAVPKPAQASGGTWNWVSLVDRENWREQPIGDINFNATLQTPAAILEGWLRLTNTKE